MEGWKGHQVQQICKWMTRPIRFVKTIITAVSLFGILEPPKRTNLACPAGGGVEASFLAEDPLKQLHRLGLKYCSLNDLITKRPASKIPTTVPAPKVSRRTSHVEPDS